MTTTITCPNCGTTITVEPAPVHCACCGRVIQGRASIGGAGSDYEGKPLCEFCEGVERVGVAGQGVWGCVGPSEVKGE